MGRLRALKLGFGLSILVLSIVNSYASDIANCRTGCRGAPSIFKYVEGTTYKYNLDGNIDVTLSSAEGQSSNTKLKATVLLTQLPNCDQLLKLQNVHVIGTDAKKYGNIDGIDKPIRINFHDGHIEDSICAFQDDNQNSLNIKRAVASLFQAAVKEHYETDVFGVCPTDINTRKEGPNMIIQKSRNLNRCSHRESIKQDFMATAFNINSEIKSSPILDGRYSAEQKLKNGILDYAAVTEHYLYMPFSVGQHGAKATAVTKIQFAGTVKQGLENMAGFPKSIIFENPHPITSDKSNVNAILAALKEAKHTIGIAVGEKSARSFANVVSILRISKKDDILAVYGQVRAGAGFQDKEEVKQIFLDALFRTGTGESVEVGIELLKNRELNEIEQKLVYLSLAFVKHATISSLDSAAKLLDIPNAPREAYLGVGILANRYCREHSCKNVEALDKLLQKLLSKLGDGKPKNRLEENQAISVLKGIANARYLSDAAANKVVAIAQDKKAPNRLRAVALETLLTDSCKDKVRDSAFNILKDIQQDSEIRIKAYLVVANCPNGKIANGLKALLDKEPSYQVGGFIVSHLNNLKASANPDKENAKYHLGQISTTKKFPINLRKYSCNNEYSHTVDSLGLGCNLESNIIYSQDSFLPRDLSLNVTGELFGHSFNFMELGFRQENLDRLLEHYFGPLGVLKESPPEELVKSGRASMERIYQHIQQRLAKTRGKRDVTKAEIDNIGKQMQIKTNDLNKDLDLDFSLKLLGSEHLFLSLNDDSSKFSPDAIIEDVFNNIDDCISKAKHFEKSVLSNLILIDSEFSYPTSLGFPLRLSVKAVSSMKVKAAGKVDVYALMNEKHSQNSPFKLSLIPSANIEVVGSMTVDAQVVKSGIKVASTLHTATGGDLDITVLNDNRGIDVKFGLPVEHQKLISATHEIIFVTREFGKENVNHLAKFGQNKDFSVCIDQLSPFVGLVGCVKINSPSAQRSHGIMLPFPLSGNGKFAVEIEKEDLSHFHYKELEFNEANKLGVEYIIEAIGADNVQKTGLHVEAFVAPEVFIKATLVSPLMPLTVEGRVTNTNQEKSISLQFQHDKQKYLGKLGVGIAGTESKATYKPLLEYSGPGIQGESGPLRTEGGIIVERIPNGAKYTFDNVHIISGNQKSFSVQGTVEQDNRGFKTDLTTSDGTHSGSLKSKVQFEKNALKVDAEFKNSHRPDANFNLKYEFTQQPAQVESKLELIHGRDLTSKTHKLTLDNMVYYKRKSPSDFAAQTKNHMAYPLMKVESKFDAEYSPKHLEYDVHLHYGALKFGSEMEVKVGKKAADDYEMEFKLYGLENKVELKSKREVMGDKSKIDNSLEVNGKKFEVVGTVTHHCKREDLNIGADLVFKVPGRAEPLKYQNGLVLNPDEIDTHLKISSGSSVYVDVFLKGTKEGNANGNLKITLKDIIIANGQLRVAKGAGNAHIIVELVKSHRKLKADSTFTIAEPTFDVIFNFYPHFEKDNNYKLVLSTQNQIRQHFIDSRNFIEFSGKKLEANFKSSLDGKITDGKMKVEADVTLPTDQHFAAKLDRELHVVNDIGNGNVFASFEARQNKNAPGNKLTIKGTLKDANIKEHVFDIDYNIVAEKANGQILTADINAKSHLDNDKHAVEGSLQIAGPILPHPINIHGRALFKNYIGTYKVESKCGPEASFIVDGEYDFEHEDKKAMCALNMELVTPSDVFHIFKFGTSTLILNPETPEGDMKVIGTLLLFMDDKGRDPEATIDIKLANELTLGPDKGQLKSKATFLKKEPIILDVGYKSSDVNNVQKLDGHLFVDYDKGKTIKSELSMVRLNENEHKFDLKLDSPNSPNTRLEIHTKKTSDDKIYNSEIIATVNNQRFVLTKEIVFSELSPSLDIKLLLPNGKEDRFAMKTNRHSPKNFGSELLIVITENDFSLESSLDANVESVDDFLLKFTANSAALKIDKFVFEALNKPAKGGKRIHISAECCGKNILSGSTTYKAREEGGKYIVEGSGNIKVKDESKQATFKFSREKFTMAKNGEVGEEMLFNAGLGSKAVDAELKLTNKHFRILNSYCEEKKQCAHVEVDSKTNVISDSEFNNELEIAVDLRKLGLSHEFGLKGVTTRKHFMLDHTVDVYFQSKANKYQYSLYVHPHEAGAQLTTPHRVISLEGTLQMNKLTKAKGKTSSPVKGEIAFYLNKRDHPDKKTALLGVFDCQDNKPVHICIAEIKFTNPALGKDLSVKYTSKNDITNMNYEEHLVVDLFMRPEHIITASTIVRSDTIGEFGVNSVVNWEFKSQGLNFDFKYEGLLRYDPSKAEIKYKDSLHTNIGNSKYHSAEIFEFDSQQILCVIKVLNIELINSNTKYQISADNVIANTNINGLGIAPVVGHLEIKGAEILTYTIARKATPNDKITILIQAIPDKIAEIRAEAIKGGATHNLLHAYVKLDEKNFLKSDSSVNNKNIQTFVVETAKNDLKSFLKEFETKLEGTTKDVNAQTKYVAENMKNQSPNFVAVREFYRNELQKLREEIVSDKVLKKVEEFLRGVFGALFHSIGEILGQVSDITEKTVATMQLQFGRSIKFIDKEIVPKVVGIAQSILKVTGAILDQLADIVFTYIANVSIFIEEHQEEIKRLTNVYAVVMQDVGRFLYKVIQQTRIVAAKEWNEFYTGVKNLPIVEELKVYYSKFFAGVELPAPLINTFKEAMITLKESAPSPDLKKLIAAIGDYVEKKLKREPVEDMVAIKNIVQLFITFLDKLWSSEVSKVDKPVSFFNKETFTNLPKLSAIKFSPLSRLITGRHPSWNEIIYALSLNPVDWLPPYKLDAVVIQGQHIFTFDGKHLTFPGNCNYMLARDAVNGNFSIAMTMTNGLNAAITFADKTNVVTVKTGGQVLVNNAATELPVNKHHLHVLREYDSIVIHSKAGVRIVCGTDLLVCGIHVSGFYHGQLKGLLGNGNSEPYDDYTIPNGKIVMNEAEFGNSYKMGAGCAAVSTVDHSAHHHNPVCAKLFGDNSPLRVCYPFVNPENYRMACAHGLAAGVEDTEFAVVMGYVANCRFRYIPVNLPEQFVKCSNGPQPYNLGDTFNVKTPAKAADIVVIVDEAKSNEVVYKELLQPVLSQISNELNSKGINDVEMHLITYGGEHQQHHAHHTVTGKLTFKGKSPTLKFSEEPKRLPYNTGCPEADDVLERLRLLDGELQLIAGQTAQQKSYADALQYPFRAHAVKAIVAAIAKPCNKGIVVGMQKLRSLLFANDEIALSVITPIEDFSVRDAKQTKNVIGFNSRHVFTLSDAKKKPEGSSDLHSDLEYNDFCIDYMMKNHGNVFVTNNFLHVKGGQRKQFAQVVSHNIVEQLTNVERELECSCEMVTPYTAQNVCNVISSKVKAAPAKKGGHKG